MVRQKGCLVEQDMGKASPGCGHCQSEVPPLMTGNCQIWAFAYHMSIIITMVTVLNSVAMFTQLICASPAGESGP